MLAKGLWSASVEHNQQNALGIALLFLVHNFIYILFNLSYSSKTKLYHIIVQGSQRSSRNKLRWDDFLKATQTQCMKIISFILQRCQPEGLLSDFNLCWRLKSNWDIFWWFLNSVTQRWRYEEVVHLLALVWREMPDLKNLEKLDSVEKLL